MLEDIESDTIHQKEAASLHAQISKEDLKYLLAKCGIQ